VKSLDRDVAEGGVESIRIDVRVRDCGGEAPERIDECKHGALEFVSRCVTDGIAKRVVGVVIDEDSEVFGVAAPDDMVEQSADVRVDEVASALAAPPEMAAVQCELSIGNSPLGLEAGGASGNAVGHIGSRVGETAELLGAERQAAEYGGGEFVRRECC